MDFLTQILSLLQPSLLELISTVLLLLIGMVSMKVKEKFGLDIEARHRDALHSALMTGAQVAIQKSDVSAAGDAVIKEVVEYAKQSVPDAMSKLGPSDSVLWQLAESKVSDVLDRLISKT